MKATEQTNWIAADAAARQVATSLPTPAARQFAVEYWESTTGKTGWPVPTPQTDAERAIANTLRALPATYRKPYDSTWEQG
jgi:hypothetical protein